MTAAGVILPCTNHVLYGIGWIGPDDRGVELEVYLLERPDVFLAIHVMPTELRRKK